MIRNMKSKRKLVPEMRCSMPKRAVHDLEQDWKWESMPYWHFLGRLKLYRHFLLYHTGMLPGQCVSDYLKTSPIQGVYKSS